MRRGFLLFFLILSCEMPSIVDRMVSDYFPYEEGREWIFLKNGEDTLYQKILGDTVLFGDSVFIVESFGEVQYIHRDEESLKNYRKTIVYRWGEEILLEERFSLNFELPLVINNEWRDTYSNTVVVYGDTFSINYNLVGKVQDITEITVPSGKYSSVYKVFLREEEEIREKGDRIFEGEEKVYYLAPDIGPVKIEILKYTENDTTFDVLELLDFKW
jgi:hypothetical protein